MAFSSEDGKAAPSPLQGGADVTLNALTWFSGFADQGALGAREKGWRAGAAVLGPGSDLWQRAGQGRPASLGSGVYSDGSGRQRVGVCVGVGQTSCPALELLPAGAGRRCVWTEFGTSDGPTAALDRKVSSRVRPSSPAQLGGPQERGRHYWLLGDWGRARRWRGQGNRPLWAPFPNLAGRERSVWSPGASAPPLAGFEGDVLAPLLGLGGLGMETTVSEKAGVSESLGRGPSDRTCNWACPRTLGPYTARPL